MAGLQELKELLPKDLADQLVFVQDRFGQHIVMYYDSHAMFSSLEVQLPRFHVTVDVAFRFADESLIRLSPIGRQTFETACEDIHSVLQEFTELGFQPYGNWALGTGRLITMPALKAVYSSIGETASALTNIHHIGLHHDVSLPADRFVAQAIEALADSYSIRWDDSLSHFRMYDQQGAYVASCIESGIKHHAEVRFSWRMTFDHIPSSDTSAQALFLTKAYIIDALKTIEAKSEITLREVIDVSKGQDTLTLEVHCSANCKSVSELQVILEEREQIIMKNAASGWRP